MISKSYHDNIRRSFKSIDWNILIFLLLFLNVKLAVKLAAIVVIFLLQFNFKFGFRLRNSRLPLFYPIVIGIGILNWLITAGFAKPQYNFTFLTGIGFWLFSILAIHQVKLSVERHDPSVIHKTINVFFIINAIASLAMLMIIVYKTGTINPYLYQGEYQKYFIGTGDYIKGISFDTSTTNSVLNAFGIIYFFTRKKAIMGLLCMIILLLTGSNITNMILCVVLLFVFIFQSDRDQKSLILICLFLLVIFMAKVSPQNNQYLVNSYETIFNIPGSKETPAATLLSIREKPDSILTPEERKQKIAVAYLDSLYVLRTEKQKNTVSQAAVISKKPSIPGDDIDAPAFQYKSIITTAEENMFQFISTHPAELPLSSKVNFQPSYPGKLIAWQQTINYLQQHPGKIITGLGTGNFSSKLAFRTSGINVAGAYPEKYKYINNAFLSNHLDLYLYYFSKADGLHSIINNPSSAYDQLLGEYGLSGLLAFFIFYTGFFLRSIRKLTYGIPLILLLSGVFFIDYWFEQLSVVVFFELLLFLNIKESTIRI
ncbi:MAG: hypothetical protein ABI863_23990 [Ginsengibacter sp.]